LRDKLKPEGYYTSVAIPPKTKDDIPWLQGYDYSGIGAAVDFVFIMAYDWHETHSLPGPVAPINEIRKTIEYALYHMPANKIFLGLQRYGYDWTMSNGTPISARAISIENAVETALKYNAPIQYSLEYQQPFYTYIDELGLRHIVWFGDATARSKRFQLVIDYGLRGLGAWQLGLGFVQSDFLANEFFNIKKVL
jgi:spore germination protein YaaH